MGNVCGGGDVDPEQAKKSKEIDTYLKNKGKDMKKEVKLLLLGTSFRLEFKSASSPPRRPR